jgi:hypothetical protein
VSDTKHTPKYLNGIITPIGRASYPKLVAPDTKGEKPDNKFKVTLLIPKDSKDFEAFKAKITAFAKEVFPNVTKKNYGNPIKDGDKKEGYEGHWYLTAKTKAERKPLCVNVAAEPIDAAAVLGGLNCRLKVSLMSYVGVDKARDSEGNVVTETIYGVTPLLEVVQLTGGGEPFGGGATADGMAMGPSDMPADKKKDDDGDI